MLQLTIYGTEETLPSAAIALVESQRAILQHARANGGVIRSVEAGRIVHAGRNDGEGCYGWIAMPGTSRREGCCEYAATDGLDAMKRLAAKGLFERGEHGWELVVRDG